jgi:hypothetical protein
MAPFGTNQLLAADDYPGRIKLSSTLDYEPIPLPVAQTTDSTYPDHFTHLSQKRVLHDFLSDSSVGYQQFRSQFDSKSPLKMVFSPTAGYVSGGNLSSPRAAPRQPCSRWGGLTNEAKFLRGVHTCTDFY